MKSFKKSFPCRAMAVSLSALMMLATVPPGAHGASHREAPLIALDPAADNTDTYAFRSWQDPSKVVFIMNVIPGQDPADGPNYFNFDDDVLYRFHVDNDQDGEAEDRVYEFRFKTENRPALGQLSFGHQIAMSAQRKHDGTHRNDHQADLDGAERLVPIPDQTAKVTVPQSLC